MFENITVYDKTAAKAAARVWTCRGPLAGMIRKKRNSIIGGVEAAGGLYLMLLSWERPRSMSPAVLSLCLLIGVIALVWGGILLFRGPLIRRCIEWGLLRACRKKGRDPECRWTFTEDSFRPDTAEGRQYGYDALRAAYETTGFFVLDFKDIWIVVSQSGFTQGTPEDFREFLERAAGFPVERVD